MFGKAKQIVQEKITEPVKNAVIIAWSAIVIAVMALIVAVTR